MSTYRDKKSRKKQMDDELTTETKLELVSIELESLAADIQVIEDNLIAIQKKYGRGRDDGLETR